MPTTESESTCKMFRLSERLSSAGAPRSGSKRYLRRAALFAAGLGLLWVALQLVPSEPPTPEPSVYSDESGTVAHRQPEAGGRTLRLLTGGNVAAMLLLAGGVAVAVYLRRRSKDEEPSVPITTLGQAAVGQNQSLRLVECGGEVLLLGVTSGQINLLRTYDDGRFDELRSALADEESAPAPALKESHFSDVLRQYAGRSTTSQQNGTTC